MFEGPKFPIVRLNDCSDVNDAIAGMKKMVAAGLGVGIDWETTRHSADVASSAREILEQFHKNFPGIMKPRRSARIDIDPNQILNPCAEIPLPSWVFEQDIEWMENYDLAVRF